MLKCLAYSTCATGISHVTSHEDGTLVVRAEGIEHLYLTEERA